MFLRVRVGGPSFLKLADVCPLDGAGKFKSTHSIVNRHSIDEYSRYTIKSKWAVLKKSQKEMSRGHS